MHRTSVYFIIPSLRGGGAERVITTLLNHIDRSRFSLTLVVVNSHGSVYCEDLLADIEYIDIDRSRVLYALPRVISLIWTRRPDIVLSTLSHLNLALAISRPFLPKRTRFIARESIVISEMLKTLPYAILWKWAFCLFYRKFDLLICQSTDMRDDLVSNICISADKTVVIHNPVDTVFIRCMSQQYKLNDIQAKNERVNIVSAGRLSAQKGFDLLLQALALLNDSRVYLTILGQGPLQNELLRQAIKLDISDRVRFVGFQRNPYPWFAEADVFVLSSRYEGFPNVVLEALACHTPVIATPGLGGAREILDKISGCVVADEVSAPALADAIRKWMLSDRVRIDEQAVAPYELEVILTQYERKFDQVVGSAK